ncbi:MAG: T9SS type A sorting domain-containing protein [Calditrichaceae bacterium]|nr:T9SS type A sorting domain-containing protein [Calditrichia bacterium]NUQ40551.1 T9SS type A sorting domain-containing protein [Calditrichaceae bacterium]
MKRNAALLFAAFGLLFPALITILSARENPRERAFPYPQSPGQFNERAALLNINNISLWIRDTGLSAVNPNDWSPGVKYPRGSATVVYQDGIIWGGLVQDPDTALPKLRVGGQTYYAGTVAGPYPFPRPPFPHRNIYRIRRDYLTVSDAELYLDLAGLLEGWDFYTITQKDIDSLRARYQRDWNEWPVQSGAPFYDLNQNGVYEPEQGETPGLANADQVIWFVCNDSDPGVAASLYGSPPIGLELQGTLWGYKSEGALGQAAFKRYRLINKSNFAIDSMFIAQWSDVDLGSYYNDFLGCDSLLNLGYCYNGKPLDDEYQAFGLPPAAIGYLLLQGPEVPSPGDTASFNFRKILDYENLPMTSFWAKATGSVIGDPTLSDYAGTLEWYNLLNGCLPTADTANPILYTHGAGPHAGRPTKFPLNGDPLSGIGDIEGEGVNLSPGDRRLAMCSGPFTMPPGEMQEIVIALVGGIDPQGDYLSSVAELQNNAREIKRRFDSGLFIPGAVHSAIPIGGRVTELRVQADLGGLSGVTGCEVEFIPRVGEESPFTLTLFDDGAHNDGAPGDNLWGNTAQVPNKKYPCQGDLRVAAPQGAQTLAGILPHVRLRPAPQLRNWRVAWENGRQDGLINPNEKVHLVFDIYNPDSLNALDSLEVINPEGAANFNFLKYAGAIPPGAVNQINRMEFELLGPAQGDSLRFRFRVRSDFHSEVHYAALPLRMWRPHELWRDTLEVAALSGFPGNLLPVVADPERLTGHEYLVEFEEDSAAGAVRWRLSDLTAGALLLANQEIGSSAKLDYPVADGIEWKVSSPLPGIAGKAPGDGIVEVAYAGSPLSEAQWDDQGKPFRGNTVWHNINSTREYYVSAGGGSGNINRLLNYIYLAAPRDFEIRFSEAGGFAVYGFENSMICSAPFELWDIGIATPGDPSDDARMIPFVFSQAGPQAQWGWATGADPARHFPASDWIYCFDPADSSPGSASYDLFAQRCSQFGGPGGVYNGPWGEVINGYGGLAYPLGRVTICDYPPNGAPPPPGTVIRFVTTKPARPGDRLKVLAPKTPFDPNAPLGFELDQNYPNPFNGETRIRFYLSKAAEVRLDIFNLLGQRVRTLVNGRMDPGENLAAWDGRSEAGRRVSSGIYFCRLQGEGRATARKLVLVR